MPYRLLTPAEIVQKGDQSLDDDCEGWTEVPETHWNIGRPYRPDILVPFRRFELAEANGVFGRKKLAI